MCCAIQRAGTPRQGSRCSVVGAAAWTDGRAAATPPPRACLPALRSAPPQVSHHPPVGAGHGETELWTYDIVSAPKTKFLGNSVEVYPIGGRGGGVVWDGGDDASRALPAPGSSVADAQRAEGRGAGGGSSGGPREHAAGRHQEQQHPSACLPA